MGIFRFKQFSVNDEQASMKVGTDAVLLGAWADLQNAKRILEIGTGSGVIALIAAQRSTAECTIDAVERLQGDAEQALENVTNSPWPARISVHPVPIQEFIPSSPYDVVICNPPYFSSSQLPRQKERASVRHTTELTTEELILSTLRVLSPAGRLSIILPFSEAGVFLKKISNRLCLRRHTAFFTRAGKPQERSLMEFSREAGTPIENTLTLYSNGDTWTVEYRELVREFYLYA